MSLSPFAPLDEKSAAVEGWLNTFSHIPVLHYGSAPLRAILGATQIALGILYSLGQFFRAFLLDPEAEENFARGCSYIFHGALNFVRAGVEELPFSFVLTWIYDCFYPHRYNYREEIVPLGVYPLNAPPRAFAYNGP